MLSETDIHYISGFLYVASGGAVESAILGERVHDTASNTQRDVDIVIKRAGDVAFIGVEVKDETRPLDITLVEQLCAKFEDMPSLGTRAIISSSGYTAPARRKAAAHGVTCLTLVHAPIPPFPSVDLSQLPGITFITGTWIEGPHVHLVPGVALSPEEREAIMTATVQYHVPDVPPCTVQELCDRIAQMLQLERGPDKASPTPVRSIVQIPDKPSVEILGREIVIDDALITGEAEFKEELIPFETCCHLADEDGSPFAATAIVAIDTGLLGLTVTRDGRELRAFSIPSSVRNVRPLRAKIA
ncbi:MAG: hypothetical protein AABO58_00855 [Acidobacteriota bacterium]